MATNEVITALVSELRPVAPLPLPAARTLRWASAAAVLAAAAVAALGLRVNLASAAATSAFQVHALFLLVAAWGSAAAALMSAVPGETQSGPRLAAPWLALSGWCMWLAAEVLWLAADGGAWWPVTAGWGCVAKWFIVGFLPGVVLGTMIARAAPQDLRRAGMLAAMAGAAVGAIGVELTCHMSNPMHLLVWHAGPVVAIVVAVSAVATLLIRRVDGRRVR